MPLSDVNFCLLCRNGLYDEIEDALRDGAFVNAAVEIPSEGLISRIKSIFGKGKITTTPLVEAARNNPSASVINLMYEYGADPEKPDSSGTTPLDAALSAGRTDNALALLKICNDKDGAGKNMALMSAAKDGNIPAVRELIKEGADLNARNSEGSTALMIAVENRHLKTATIMIEAIGDNIMDKGEVLVKAVSAKKPSHKLIERLLDWGADAGKAVSYARENRELMGSRILRRIISESRGKESVTSRLKTGA